MKDTSQNICRCSLVKEDSSIVWMQIVLSNSCQSVVRMADKAVQQQLLCRIGQSRKIVSTAKQILGVQSRRHVCANLFHRFAHYSFYELQRGVEAFLVRIERQLDAVPSSLIGFS